MDRESSQIDDDAPAPITDVDPVIDFENDQVDIRNDVDDDLPDEDPISDEPEGDLDGLSDLLATDAKVDFLGEPSAAGVVDGFNDLLLRYPKY